MKKLIIATALLTATSGLALAQEWKVVNERPYKPKTAQETAQSRVDTTPVTKYNTNFKPLDRNYIFGSIGSTTGKKSSTAFSIGYGYDVLQFAEGRGALALEGGYTRLNGKKLSSLGNENKGGGKYAIDNKNLVELGAKVSYHFDQVEDFNLRLYGKAGIASTTLKDFNQITPVVGAGVEFGPKGSPFIFDLGVKSYTDARKAKITYKPEDVTGDYNTKKALTTINLGVSYHF